MGYICRDSPFKVFIMLVEPNCLLHVGTNRWFKSTAPCQPIVESDLKKSTWVLDGSWGDQSPFRSPGGFFPFPVGMSR